VCLDAIGQGAAVQGRCNLACQPRYHAQCYEQMRRACKLDCAICRTRSAGTAGTTDASYADDAGLWTTFDGVDDLGSVHAALITLIVFVLLPPMLLLRLVFSFSSLF